MIVLRTVSFGEMAEWSKAPVSKTGILKGIEGSNPSLSARVGKAPFGGSFQYKGGIRRRALAELGGML